jgi:Fe-S cluster assembly iron-binding protein IscA
MHIDISVPAKTWLERKCAFYTGRNRLPRIILAAQTCHGAEFRLHFDTISETDLRLDVQGITIVVEPDLMDKYGGFALDLESFFFTNRLLIKPLNEIKQCDCGKARPCGE